MKKKIKYFIITFFIFFYLDIKSDEESDIQYLQNSLNKILLKNFVIEELKKQEGFVNRRYICPGNQLTIGYGHVIKKGEKIPQIIEESYADSLLRKDFDQSYDYINQKYPKLPFNKQIALSHFVFGLGSYKFEKSSLPKLINNDKAICNKLKEFCKVKKKIIKDNIETDTIIFYKNLLDSRLFEIKIWNEEFNYSYIN
jgi:GH24 family phage-related lysozyme (muramidase)